MPDKRPPAILCITSFEKGQEFMRECKRSGWTVFLLTVEKLKDAGWPRDSLDDIFFLPENLPLDGMIHAVSYLSRTRKLDRIVALDEFDMETAAALREHLRVPGMGLTTLRYFRDKLAMRAQAHEHAILVPPFTAVINHDEIREYMARVPGPWVLKPRSEASAIGIKKIKAPDEIWPLLDVLGDRQSFFVLEKFVPGEVFHVDSVVSERKIVFQAVSRYGHPPMRVAHEGGIFTTRILPRAGAESKELVRINKALIMALGLVRGVTHAEFIQSAADGKFFFLECAARVGGAYINEMVEAATGVNLWREWARMEMLGGRKPYSLPKVRNDYSGVILSLARQPEPDTSAYIDPEIAIRIKKHHHAGFVLRSKDAKRIPALLDSYADRFVHDFMATQPLPERPTS
ncbi:MAG: ATP-grasp domain-containing protein [Acidobacteriales bacterium]|nr:ATP-grasp domain-containing protein [Terriglobales bacterium]